jgi:hypothetical protein
MEATAFTARVPGWTGRIGPLGWRFRSSLSVSPAAEIYFATDELLLARREFRDASAHRQVKSLGDLDDS